MNKDKSSTIIIAEAGSTKTEWYIGLSDNAVITSGINPYQMSKGKIKVEVEKLESHTEATKISKIFFYGAGCSTVESKSIIETILRETFPNANHIYVGHDIEASAISTSQGTKSHVGIMGTGSSSAFYNGTELIETLPALGYKMADEGGGSDLGRRLLKKFAYRSLPADLMDAMKEEFSLSSDKIKHDMYLSEIPTTQYFASHVPFIHRHKERPEIKEIIYSSMEEFIVLRIKSMEKLREYPLNLVGSIAHYFEKEIREIASKHDVKIDKILQKPGKELQKAIFKSEGLIPD